MTDEAVLQAAIQVLERKLTHIRMLAISEQAERMRQIERPILPMRFASTKPEIDQS